MEMFEGQNQIAGNQDEIVGGANEAGQAESTSAEVKTNPEQEQAWRKRFASPEQMFEQIRKLQSETDKLKEQIKRLNTNETKSSEYLLEQFVSDPDGYIKRYTAPIEAKATVSYYLLEHPEYSKYKDVVMNMVGDNVAVLSDPNIVDMVFTYVKAKDSEVEMSKAMQKAADNEKKIASMKANDAFVENSSTSESGKAAKPTLKLGMSVKESEEILERLGIPPYQPL